MKYNKFEEFYSIFYQKRQRLRNSSLERFNENYKKFFLQIYTYLESNDMDKIFDSIKIMNQKTTSNYQARINDLGVFIKLFFGVEDECYINNKFDLNQLIKSLKIKEQKDQHEAAQAAQVLLSLKDKV